ncbi:MAG TPA: SH3 domain-containing protein [Candidatus Ventrimonas merdavium]|nr:SH3 domain-containing protein [Candidatus Ventrimonas merdavium]
MKTLRATLITILATILVLAAAAGGVFWYIRYSPSKTLADQSVWYGVSGDEIAVFLDNEKVDGMTGRYRNGQPYLPLEWVVDTLNERFYWDEANSQLIYTLPEEIVYADASSIGSNGAPLFIQEGGQVWLLTALVDSYTDIRTELFADGDARRLFVNTSWEPIQVSQVKKGEMVRVRGGIKSEILTEAAEGDQVTVLETLENWSRVRTADGQVGYMRNKRLEEAESQSMISTFDAPVYTNISMEEPVVMVWHQTTIPEANRAMEELIANTKGVNVIAPTWFMLTDNSGSYDSLADRSYVEKAHSLGMQVWAVLDNFNRGSNVQSEILFASTEARKKLIADLISEVQQYGIDGINLDIEGIKPEAGPHYVQFIRELSVDCRKQGIVLSVDTYVPSAYTEFYNRAEQGRVADYVIIMGYDEHYAGGEAGSVASLGYERKGIEDTLEVVPAEKVISAIPFYTRIWKTADDGSVTSDAMGIAQAKKWVEENQVELYWQEELGQYYGEIRKDGQDYAVWMEEERSIGLKMDLIRDNGLAGVACWKLGFEPATLWDVVKLP